eukprot:3607962-Rhodomonas_salina.1
MRMMLAQVAALRLHHASMIVSIRPSLLRNLHVRVAANKHVAAPSGDATLLIDVTPLANRKNLWSDASV